MFKNFLRDSVGFTFANILIKALNLILIPIYVRLLSFEEYGIFELITTLTIIFVVVISLEVTQSILRFVADSSTNKNLQDKYIETGLSVIFISSCAFIPLVYFFSPIISQVLFKDYKYSEIIEISSWIICLQSLNYAISVVFRSEKKFYFAIRHSVLVAIFSGSFSLSLLFFFSGSLRALLIGQAIGAVIAASIGLFLLRDKFSFSPDYRVAKKMLMFSIPLVFSGVALHLSSFADRIIINELLSLEALAVYGIAAKAASIITILISGVQGALSPHFISTWNTSLGLQSLTRIFFIYLMISILLLLSLNFIGEYIIIFLGTSAAIGGMEVLLILASSSIINGLNIFLFGLIKALKTSVLSMIYLFTAVLNIYLNYSLIKDFGIEGAAFATLISASIGFLIHYHLSSKHIKLPFSFLIPSLFIISIISFNILMLYLR